MTVGAEAGVDATVEDIARHLDISPNTVNSKLHLKAAYKHLAVNSRIELAEHSDHGR